MSDFFDRDLRPLTVTEWAELFEQDDYRQVELTHLDDGRLISTIWEGISMGGAGKKGIFETAVMTASVDGETWRSVDLEALIPIRDATEGLARETHLRVRRAMGVGVPK
jgi:hypothetical protein